MTALFDHLWQSTLVAAALGLMTLLFRRNRASLRYALWFAASMKFLVPFSALTVLGAALFHPLAPAFAAPNLFYRIGPAAAPFTTASPALIADRSTGSYLEPLFSRFGPAASSSCWPSGRSVGRGCARRSPLRANCRVWGRCR